MITQFFFNANFVSMLRLIQEDTFCTWRKYMVKFLQTGVTDVKNVADHMLILVTETRIKKNVRLIQLFSVIFVVIEVDIESTLKVIIVDTILDTEIQQCTAIIVLFFLIRKDT